MFTLAVMILGFMGVKVIFNIRNIALYGPDEVDEATVIGLIITVLVIILCVWIIL